jgi:hypothetical protein
VQAKKVYNFKMLRYGGVEVETKKVRNSGISQQKDGQQRYSERAADLVLFVYDNLQMVEKGSNKNKIAERNFIA